MSGICMALVLSMTAGLSPETQERVNAIDSMTRVHNPSLQTRVFLVTGPCIPGIGYETCEMTVGEVVYTEVVDDNPVTVESTEWLRCRFTHAGFRVTSEFFFPDEGTEPVLCVSTWEIEGEPPLFTDRFYFADGRTIACSFGEDGIVEPSEEDLRRGADRLHHAAELLEAVRTLFLPAPPMYLERVLEAYEVL